MEYVIIGNGGAGTRAAQAIRKLDGEGGIVIIDREPHRCYYRMMLPDYICGWKQRDSIFVVDEGFYRDNRIDFRPGTAVAGVDTTNREVKLEDGGTVTYDRLLIAAGARPRDYTAPGGDKDGVMALRTLDQAEEIMARAGKARKAVALGGGLLGVEMARCFCELGLETSYIIREDRFWPQMLDTASSAIVERKLVEKGIILLKEDGIEEVLSEAGKVSGVQTTTGRELPAGLVGVAIGVVSNVEFLAGSGIETKSGVLVDEGMRSSAPGVFAAGDVAQAFDPVCGEHRVNTSFVNALRTGQVAGANMAGGSEVVEGYTPSNLITIYGVPVASMGMSEKAEEGLEVLTGDYPRGEVHKKYVFRGDRLVGATLIGETGDARVLERLITARVGLGGLKERVFEEGFDWKAASAGLPGA